MAVRSPSLRTRIRAMEAEKAAVLHAIIGGMQARKPPLLVFAEVLLVLGMKEADLDTALATPGISQVRAAMAARTWPIEPF